VGTAAPWRGCISPRVDLKEAYEQRNSEITPLAESFNAEFERGLDELQATGAILSKNQIRRCDWLGEGIYFWDS
jgi:hypothetical protein